MMAEMMFAKFCPQCGEAKPKLLTRKAWLAKHLRYQCEACKIIFVVEETGGRGDGGEA